MASRMSVYPATRLLVATAFVAFVSACSGGGDGPIAPSGPASIDLTPSGNIRLLNVGETVQLTASPKDAKGNPVSATVTWTSTATSVATVSGTGLVTATGFGTATIRASAGGVSKETSVLVQPPEGTVSFNVNAEQACTSPELVNARLEATSAHLLIYADLGNPPNGFTTADYQEFAATFESLVWPVLTENFGVPTDIDNNGRVIALFTKAVNKLTQPNQTGVVGGFFFGRDLFPKTATTALQACPASNFAEMFYLLVPDPTGSIGPGNHVRITRDVKRITTGVIGHEMQHLINSSRRLYINTSPTISWPETIYMEEGLSHIAEELLFYESTGGLAAPRMNLGDEIIDGGVRQAAFNLYMISNAGRKSRYLKSPNDNAPYRKTDNLETRGAAWSFLRYLADRGTSTVISGSEPVCGSPVSLSSVGQRCRVDGAAAAQFNVAAAGSVQEFTIVAFAADVPSVQVGVTSTGQPIFNDGTITTTASATSAINVVGPPSPSLAPSAALLSLSAASGTGPGGGGLQLDYTVHDKLRRMERRDLPHRVPGARAEYARRNVMAAQMYTAPGAPSMAVTAFEPIWGSLVNTPDTGMTNLRNRFGSDITGAARDWAVAHYVDDIGLSGLPVQYTHRSWNFRTLLPRLTSNGAKDGIPGTYPVKVHVLTNPLDNLVMTNGGAMYYRLGVAAGTTSTVSFTMNSGSIDRLKLTVVRTR